MKVIIMLSHHLWQHFPVVIIVKSIIHLTITKQVIDATHLVQHVNSFHPVPANLFLDVVIVKNRSSDRYVLITTKRKISWADLIVMKFIDVINVFKL